jgi:hypothetical protein
MKKIKEIFYGIDCEIFGNPDKKLIVLNLIPKESKAHLYLLP